MNGFITYARSEKDHVLFLSKDLHELSHKIWLDTELHGGQHWWNNILEQIRNCDFYIFTISKQSLDSVACKRELEYANALQKPILPVLLEPDISLSVIPRILSSFQFVDYTKPENKSTIISIFKAISQLPPSAPLPDPLPPAPLIPISYLDTLKDKIESPSMEKNEQFAIVSELKNKLNNTDFKKADIHSLLDKLKKRDDLLASVYLEIDQILLKEEGQHTFPESKIHDRSFQYSNESAVYEEVMPASSVVVRKGGWSSPAMVIFSILSLMPVYGFTLAVILCFIKRTNARQKRILLIISILSTLIMVLFKLRIFRYR